MQSYRRKFSHFSLAYKAALGAIALLCLGSALVVDRVTRLQLNDASVVNTAGEQRLYSILAVQGIETLANHEHGALERDEVARLLSQSLAQWKTGQNLLLDVAADEHHEELSIAVRSAGQIYGEIDQTARRALAGQPISRSELRSILAAQRNYVSAQEVVSRQLLDYHAEKISRLDQIQLLCSILIVVVLVIEGAWMFKPLLKGLRKSFEQIEEHHSELDSVRVQLAAQNDSLRENENSLSHALSRAEDMSRLSRYAAARFEELFAGLSIAAFTFDVDGTVFEWNRECESLFGMKAHRIVGRSLVEIRSNPISPREYREMVAQVFDGRHLYDLEQTIRRPSGDIRIALCNAFPLRDPEGNITGGVSVMLDVTEARQEAARIAESETLFRTSMDSLQSGILFMDSQMKLTKCNPRAAEIMGMSIEEVLTRSPERPKTEYIREDGSPLPAEELPLMVAFRSRRPVVDSVMGIRRENGGEVYISVNAAPVQIPGTEEPIGAVASFTDITLLRQQKQQLLLEMAKTTEQATALEIRTIELVSANEKLEALATTDGLTGLNNHRHFQEALERSFAGARRAQRPMSLIMLDVDHFKRFNDAYGHPAGDEVLRRVGMALESVARVTDVVARYGGEEFVIILPDTDIVGATEAAERYRRAVEQQPWTHQPVTASFGIATLVPADFDRAQLITLADAAMYESKRKGRNCCTHANELLKAA